MRALLVLALFVVGACGNKKTALAELRKMEGPVERQVGKGPNWMAAKIGTKYYLGDAARTADGGAQLEVIGNALIAMQPHTVLRFGGTTQNSKIAVELGTIELSGTGSFGFDLGDVRLSRNGTVRITANPGGAPKVELTLGEAQVSTVNGSTIDLVINTPVEVGLETVEVKAIDAGVPDAPIDAGEPDAAPAPSGVAIEITGKKAEVLPAGETKWRPVEPGTGTLAKGEKLRLGTDTSAHVTSAGTALEMGNGSRIAVGEGEELVLEAGDMRAAANAPGNVKLPGGTLALKGSDPSQAEAKLAVDKNGSTKVKIERGSAHLTGAPGSELDMNRGESAMLAKAGTIRVLDAIPSFFDFRITAGESFAIHDPRPPTAVQFAIADKCSSGGIIEMDKDNKFRTAKVSSGKDGANLSVATGRWHYRLRCTSGGGEGTAVASGTVTVMRDDGHKQLPKLVASNSIDADGRTWRISYQSQIPNLLVSSKASGAAFKLHLATEGKEEVFDGSKPVVTVSGSKLKEGTYTYWFEIDGTKQAKTSTLKIDFDQTAPQVYIELPVDRKPWEGDIPVKGAVLPGWSASIDGLTIPLDGARRFSATTQPPAGNALAIKLFHSKQGTHYYLRRAK